MDDEADPGELSAAIDRYVEYLKMSADRYEPYAANRLGLFYMTGEITGKGGTSRHKDYFNSALAKEYFNKATVCPDANSAWAFFNLIKYFHKDYDNDIEHLKGFFGSYRTLKIRVAGDLKEQAENIQKEIPEFSVSADNEWISVLVDEEKSKVLDVLGRLQKAYDIRDMQLEEISTEEVIKKIYEEGVK